MKALEPLVPYERCAQMQLALFDVAEVPASSLALASSQAAPGNCYAAHFFQRTGRPMWKLGYTEVSPLVRAKQIACIPVAWWPGSTRDERAMHRLWKHHRVSPAAEFFEHSDDMDRWILQKVGQMPAAFRAGQMEVFAQIMLRLREQDEGYGDAA